MKMEDEKDEENEEDKEYKWIFMWCRRAAPEDLLK